LCSVADGFQVRVVLGQLAQLRRALLEFGLDRALLRLHFRERHDRLRLLLPSQQVQRGHETEQDECHRYRRRRPRPQHRRPVRQVRWHVHLRRHTLRVPHGRPRELVRRLPHGQRGAQSLLQPGGRIERDCRPQQARPRQRRADPADERCQDRSDPSPVPKWKR